MFSIIKLTYLILLTLKRKSSKMKILSSLHEFCDEDAHALTNTSTTLIITRFVLLQWFARLTNSIRIIYTKLVQMPKDADMHFESHANSKESPFWQFISFFLFHLLQAKILLIQSVKILKKQCHFLQNPNKNNHVCS